MHGKQFSVEQNDALRALVREIVEEQFRGNKSKAAEALGITGAALGGHDGDPHPLRGGLHAARVVRGLRAREALPTQASADGERAREALAAERLREHGQRAPRLRRRRGGTSVTRHDDLPAAAPRSCAP